MRRIHLLCISLGLLGLSVAVAADPAADGPVVVESSMHEFMEYVYQPTYLRLKANMAKVSADPAPWKELKADALILAESGNLLLMRGPDENRADWNRHSVATREMAAELYKAARAEDAGKAKMAYTELITRCNACHDDFADGKHQLD